MNKKEDTTYSIGIVANPSKIGYSAIDDSSLKIIKASKHQAHHANIIGVRKFAEGQAKEDTRIFRSARRSKRRAQARVKWLNTILSPVLLEDDPTFFDRLKQSGLSPLDKRKKFKSQIYPTSALSVFYRKKYPTIYHIEKYLVETNEKADIHLIYNALHTLLTNRGHFNDSTPVSQFKPGKVDIASALNRLNQLFESKYLNFNLKNAEKIQSILLDKNLFNSNKKQAIKPLLLLPVESKTLEKENKVIATEIIDAMLGYSVRFYKLFSKDKSGEDAKEWTFKFNDSDVDVKIQNIANELNSEQVLIIEELQKVYSSVVLADILKGKKTLYDAKIAEYNKHKKDLNLYKKFIKAIAPEQGDALSEAYRLYMNTSDNLVDLKLKWKNNVPKDVYDFYKIIAPIVESVKTTRVDPDNDSSELKYDAQIRHYADVILNEIQKENFLKKQRTLENEYIPYQLNALTFNAILKNQGKYYPVLIESNPCEHDKKEAPYKLSQLMQFKKPYYIGPLSTPDDAKKQGLDKEHYYGWLVRRKQGTITPWNFYDMIDVVATANNFIVRSTARDTYLLSDPVLPKSSLLYQKYMVYEELSNININEDDHFNSTQKQWIFENVFKKYRTVTKKTLVKILDKNNRMQGIKSISGFTDVNDPKFNSNLSTYLSFKKIFGAKIDDPVLEEDFEKIIEWSTIFEDRNILAVKLKEITWLSDKETKYIIRNRLSGWGRFSKRLLLGLKDEAGHSILYNLIHSKRNLNQIINSGIYKEQIDKIASATAKHEDLEDILERSFTSPANRKAIKQAVKVVDEIVKLNGDVVPSKIMLRFQRSESQNKELIASRDQQLKKKYTEINSLKKKAKKQKENTLYLNLYNSVIAKELKDKTKGNRELTSKEYLYFQQLGRDGLTGTPISLNKLDKYNIVHIIPRSKLVDNSNNNLVLTLKTNIKQSAIKDYGNDSISNLGMQVKTFWIALHRLGLISKGKLKTFQTDVSQMSQYAVKGYIARQLVETSQIAKLLSTIMQGRYPNTKIIEIRHDQIVDVRSWLNLYRLPNVNDYYIGYDAYLSGVIGNYLYTVYPKMRRFFVFGEYLKKNNKKTEDKKDEGNDTTGNFNLLWQLIYGRKDSDAITVSGSQKVAFDRKDLINYMKKVYGYKYMPVSYATEYKLNSLLFKATLFPRLERDTASKRRLIPKKKGYDTSIYGGYTANQDAYFAFVELTKKDGTKQYKFYGVPVRFASQIEAQSTSVQKLRELNAIIEPQIPKNTKFRVLKSKVPFNQVIVDGEKKFILRSATYRSNIRELILPYDDLKVIMDIIVDPEFTQHFVTKDCRTDLDSKLEKVYADILYQFKHYLTALDIHKLLNKLEKGQERFAKLPLGKKIYVISQLLITTQTNPSNGRLKDIGIGAITLQTPNNPVSPDAYFVTQSPTGLRSTKIPVAKIAHLKEEK